MKEKDRLKELKKSIKQESKTTMCTKRGGIKCSCHGMKARECQC